MPWDVPLGAPPPARAEGGREIEGEAESRRTQSHPQCDVEGRPPCTGPAPTRGSAMGPGCCSGLVRRKWPELSPSLL